MKKFEIIIFYEGVVYRAYSYSERVTWTDFYSLFDSLCLVNHLPVLEVELLSFSFDFVSVDDTVILSGVDV